MSSHIPKFVVMECLLFLVVAIDSLEHGSIAILDITPGRVIVASDSRRTYTLVTPAANKDIGHSDEECKLIAISRHIIFLATGITGHPTTADKPWTVQTAAKIAAQERTGIREIGDYWGKMAVDDYQTRANTGQYPCTEDAGVGGGFVGVEANNSLVAIYVKVKCKRGKSGEPVVDYEIETLDPKVPILRGLGEGINEVDEFVENRSLRAQIENSNYHALSSGLSEIDADALKLKMLVEAAIRWTSGKPDSGIGGPVDVAILTPDGTIRWYSRKAKCEHEDQF